MAWYKAVMEGNRGAEPEAWTILSGQQQTIASDASALDALGNLSVERGDAQAAETAFRRVLVLQPADLTALSNLGILLAKQGHLQESISLLREAFDRNRDIAGLAMNLARVECMAGDAAGMRSTLESALLYNPSVPEMRKLLQNASACTAAGDGSPTQ
jgi:predicted Zn-dependent protease